MLSLFWGFRLTIWNVNVLRYPVLQFPILCFRLTIWNVNKIDSIELPYGSIVLD